nr:reverse transcriptase domain-containing protein [Tanacetum cinerariifolium]
MNPNPKGRNRGRSKQRVENYNLEEQFPLIVTMADQRIMAQLLQAPTEGYEDAIVVPAITADNFELKHGLIPLVQNKQFYGHDKEDTHAHIRYFNKITSTLKFLNVPNTSIKLMLFPFSLEGAARIWLGKEPPRSILTWDDLISKFINQFFPPSKTTSLRNEITYFQQRFDETFSEAWDRFKDLLRACPHHGFSELHQLDTFYNALNSKDQDSLNSAAGGNFLDKIPRDCLSIIESKSKVPYSRNKPVVAKVSTNVSTSGVTPDVAELKDLVRALLLDKKGQNQSLAPVKAVEESYVTCCGAHSYHNFPATDGNVYRDNIQEYVSQAFAVNYNQGNTGYRPQMMSNQIRPPGFPPVPNNQNIQQNNQNRFIKIRIEFVNSNTASTSSSGTLPSNTIANPKSDLKAITTRSGVSYDGPQIPPPMVENELEATKDTVNPTNNENTEDLHRRLDSYAQICLNSESLNRKQRKLSEMARTLLNEHCYAVLLKKLPEKSGDLGKFLIPCDFPDMAECLALANLDASINLMPYFVCKKLSLPDLTPTCITLKLADRSISRTVGVAEDVYVKVGSFHFRADFVVVDFDADPRVPLILERSFFKTGRALIDVFEGELTLRIGKEAITFNLDQTSRYSANYSDMTAKRIDVIDMACEEYSQEVLGFSDTISSGNPTPFYDLIVSATSPTLTPFGNSDFLLEEGDILLLEAFLNDDPSSPPPNQRNYLPEVRKELKIYEAKTDKSLVDEPSVVELKALPLHLEYAFLEGDDKLPVIIAKDLSVEEKNALIMMLERLARNQYYCFLDGFSGYFQIPIDPKDQEKTTFTYPYGTFAYRRMPFGLCNAPCTFQRCMMEIFHDMIEKTVEVFMDDFSVFGNSFQSCLFQLEKMLKRCEDTNLSLNWEKSYFMVKEGIVLGHKISKQGIEVDKAKVDVISKLPHPTTVKEGVYLVRKPLISSRLATLDQPEAYENSLIYKQRTKKLHDAKIKNRIFNVGDQVLLFNSRLKIFSGKLKSRWSGPFTISEIYPSGTAKLIHPDGCKFKVNCHRLKHYHGGDPPPLEIPDVHTFPKEN